MKFVQLKFNITSARSKAQFIAQLIMNLSVESIKTFKKIQRLLQRIAELFSLQKYQQNNLFLYRNLQRISRPIYCAVQVHSTSVAVYAFIFINVPSFYDNWVKW